MRASVVVLGTILFLTGLAGGVALTGRLHTQAAGRVASTPVADAPLALSTQAPATRSMARLAGGPDFTQIAEATIAAVTNISSRQVVQRRTGFSNDPFFRYFFGDTPGLSGYQERQSLGSGVIVRNDGHILTNAHVVGVQTAGVTVTLADNREYQAKLIGRDASTDIALLKINAEGLPTVPWGNSSSLRIAEWVLAVGNPFQLNQTVTLGIVSAVGRDNLGVGALRRFHPDRRRDSTLATPEGRWSILAVSWSVSTPPSSVTAVAIRASGSRVPSNLASRVMDDLIEFGGVRRGSFGYVDVRQMSPRLARELGAPDARGAVVWRIHQDSAAAQVGIEPGDVIVAFNGQPIEDPSDYLRMLSDAPIGSTVTLGVIRAGRADFVRRAGLAGPSPLVW